MGWKILFVILAIATLRGTYNLSTQPIELLDLILLILTILSTIGLYSYAFDKYLFKPSFWKAVFWSNIVSLLLVALFDKDVNLASDVSNASAEGFIVLVILVVFYILPQYFALYSLSKGKTHKEHPMIVMKRSKK